MAATAATVDTVDTAAMEASQILKAMKAMTRVLKNTTILGPRHLTTPPEFSLAHGSIDQTPANRNT